MFRLSVALWASTAFASYDETSLMQGMKPMRTRTDGLDKSKQIANLLSGATTMLKNGATPDVVDFAQATLVEITSVVLPAITDAHTSDQHLIDTTFAMFEDALEELEEGTARVRVVHDEERRHSAAHKLCREEEEVDCGNKRQCDYDLYAIWRRFVDEEFTLRTLSTEVSDHFCVEGANGTLFVFRETSVVLFPPWIEQKPVVEHWEAEYGSTVPTCERLFNVLDEKTAECDAHQANLEHAACVHGHTVQSVRETFAAAWDFAVNTYQRVADEVHCLELDRWKEWRTLATVQCLLDRTTERNGRPCDETTDEIVTELAHCEEIQVTESVEHLLITYHTIPQFPPYCATPPWENVIAIEPFPGRCVPVPPNVPCSSGFLAQEYDALWTPPQPEFHSENSHCNQRPECTTCPTPAEDPMCGVIFEGHINFIYPTPEHECHAITQAHVDSWSAVAPGDSLADVELPSPLTDLQRTRDRASLNYVLHGIASLGQEYDASFCAQSHDGCATVDGFPDHTTHNELRHAQVAEQLVRIPEMELTGQIRRQGDLGYFIFNEYVWEDDWKTFPIGADIADHRLGRPIIDAVAGRESMAWSTAMIQEKAQEFFRGRNSFTQADLTRWNNMLQHKILLDLDLTDAQELAFEEYKSQSFIISLIPKTLVSLLEPFVPQIQAIKGMRENLLDIYQEALDRDTRGIIQRFTDGRDKKFVADLFLTALTSAGGLSVPTLMGIGFAILNGAEAYGAVVLPNWQDFELSNSNAEQFVLECVRRFPAVVGFPWWDGETAESRTVMNIAMALRDPRAWDYPKQFRLRPLSEYHETVETGTKIGLAWAEQAKGVHGLTRDSRGCPGQHLSVVIMSEMMRAYMSSQHEWTVAGGDGAVQITEGPCAAGDYTLVRNGATVEPAPESPSIASVMATQDPAALQTMLEGMISQMPEEWMSLVPVDIQEILAALFAAASGQPMPQEVRQALEALQALH